MLFRFALSCPPQTATRTSGALRVVATKAYFMCAQLRCRHVRVVAHHF